MRMAIQSRIRSGQHWKGNLENPEEGFIRLVLARKNHEDKPVLKLKGSPSLRLTLLNPGTQHAETVKKPLQESNSELG